MNKKLKFISSVLCGVLIASNLGVTSVYAKNVKNHNSIKVDSNLKKSDNINIENYLNFKDGLLVLTDNLPKNEKKDMEEFVEVINKLIRTNEIKVDKNTFKISQITKSRVKRDVDIGEWHKVGYISHSTIQKIDKYIGIAGLGTSIKDVYSLVTEIWKFGILGISKADLISFFVSCTITAGIYNLKCACEDNNHNGAYILKYGDSNMYMPYHKPTI